MYQKVSYYYFENYSYFTKLITLVSRYMHSFFRILVNYTYRGNNTQKHELTFKYKYSWYRIKKTSKRLYFSYFKTYTELI